MRLARLRDERGVFVPGLMGAGILLSIVMLISDGVRRMFPVRGERARAARLRANALGRVSDLRSVARGLAPIPARIRHVPRPRLAAAVLGLLAAGTAVALVSATQSVFHADTGVLAERGWTLGAGYSAAALFGAAAAVWLASAVAGPSRSPWLDRVAAVPPLGGLPEPHESIDPIALPYEETSP